MGILTIIPTLFPALYSRIINDSNFLAHQISPWEMGLYFIPVIITSVSIFVICIILKFKPIKIPSFDVSKRIAVIGMIIILITFTGLSYQGIISEDEHQDWKLVKKAVEQWPSDELQYELHVRYFMLVLSFTLFGNYRVIPFVGSIAVLVLVYLFTKKITNNRVASLISTVIVLQSNLFLTFSSTPSYTIFWSLFYLLSIYLILHKTWYLSPLAYVLSLFSKLLTAAFIPYLIFFILNSEISIKKKIIILIIIIGVIIIGMSTTLNSNLGFDQTWNWEEFWIAFTSFTYQMRFDGLVVIFLLPIIIGLFLVSKKNRYANNISIIISGILFTNPLLLAMTDITSQPYRFIPLIIFFAIAVGIILSNLINSEIKDEKKH
jgi:hypothetical protein